MKKVIIILGMVDIFNDIYFGTHLFRDGYFWYTFIVDVIFIITDNYLGWMYGMAVILLIISGLPRIYFGTHFIFWYTNFVDVIFIIADRISGSWAEISIILLIISKTFREIY